jgi:large subunit ribosomal protein L46
MNTWLLGNHPVGHIEQKVIKKAQKTNDDGNLQVGNVTFFMKGHIMAGQADIKNNQLGVSDFKWLAKEEIQKLVPEQYWSSIQDVLPER